VDGAARGVLNADDYLRTTQRGVLQENLMVALTTMAILLVVFLFLF
jgi:hypothetical protein